MHHAEILIDHFREMVGNWPVASCYFALCAPSPSLHPCPLGVHSAALHSVHQQNHSNLLE